MSVPQHTLAPSRSHARPSRRRRFGLFPVRRRESAIIDAIEAGREDPEAVQAIAELHVTIAEAVPEPVLAPAFTGASLEPLPLLQRPVMTEPELATLARVAERLRALPAADEPERGVDDTPVLPGAYLRAIMPPDRNPAGRHPHEPLAGSPEFAGTAYAVDGRFAAGLYLGDADEDGRIVIDVMDPDWLRDCIGSSLQALCALAGAWSLGVREPVLDTLAAALRDGIDYRMSAAPYCRDCEKAADGLCPDHAEDDRRAARYQKLLGLLLPAGRDVLDTARLRPVPAAADGTQ